ncbi:putative galactinol-sucrose galactosyltransferase 6-like [Trifolium medium]|uniref:Putative galactinol-sucrose galactosyltransferase 6-like n=1 Tax=Trifolium medium TaxID=97028 RepID=A0A392M501_9FABA|nr:putative galactinol-sucrose galactosyltransferase 6-like [Trifolium medium]
MPLTLKVLEHEVFAVAPLKVLGCGYKFAPIGLVNMFNAGGAVKGPVYEDGVVRVVDFEYESDSDLLSFGIDYLPEEGHGVQIEL